MLPPQKILLADDSADNQVLIEIYLNGGPYHLTSVENGQAAVACFTEEQFDLILMDIQMPVMDGWAATRAIRDLERRRGTPAVPVIALTAHNLPEDIRMSTAAGCNCHLAKPISRNQLRGKIDEFLLPRPLHVPSATQQPF